ncbi:MAG: hypothetical protein ACRDGA_08310, partial [Bacteroidota bacterium]
FERRRNFLRVNGSTHRSSEKLQEREVSRPERPNGRAIDWPLRGQKFLRDGRKNVVEMNESIPVYNLIFHQ